MYLNISKTEANIIQVALDHLYEDHTDVLVDAISTGDYNQARQSYHIQSVIDNLHIEIKHQLQREENLKK